MNKTVIIKRDGSQKEFCVNNIINAIQKANKSVTENQQCEITMINFIAEKINEQAKTSMSPMTVEAIQDAVVYYLSKYGYVQLAMNYSKYRFTRELSRKANTTDERILSLIDLSNEEIKQENSNKNPVINSTQRDYMAGEVSRDLTNRVLLPENIVRAHEEGLIHFHDSDYFAQKMHNCFHRSERFITDTGVKTFNDCNDGECIKVLTKDGQWADATVHKYEKQYMQKVTLTSGRTKKIITCTKDHRWLLKNGEITTNLKIGDRLFCLPKSQIDEENLNPKMFCLGFIIGDGTDYNNDRVHGGIRVRLCSQKIKYEEIFKKAGFIKSKQIFKNNDVVMAKTTTWSKQEFLNNKSWKYLSYHEIVSLFLGLYAADGATKSNRLCTSNDLVVQLIRDCSAVAGYHICSENTEIRDTNYLKGSTLTTFRFMKNQTPSRNWIVKDIEQTRHKYNTWCVEEPTTKTFTLDGGVVTGNCCLVNLEDMLQNGTVISNTMIEKPKSFATACNVATQIVAQVASSQYGGQTISLAHLAPFVDVSRRKITQKVIEERTELGDSIDTDVVKRIVAKRLHDEIVAGMQTIQYQLVTLMTTNGQTPFVSVNMYLNEASDEQTKADLALIIEEMLKQRIKGTKNEKGVYVTPAFPKLLYVLEEDNMDPNGKYYYLTELAAKCTAKRMVPDYISEKVMKELKGDIYPCMGCRSFLTVDRFTDKGIGNIANSKNYKNDQHKYYGRFNQGVVTINLVDVACSSNGNMDKFWDILNERLELCHKALRCRHDRLLGTPSDVAPILWQHGALARLKKGETIDKLLYDGYSTISLGYAGLYEMCMRMTGKSHTDPEAKPFALAVMQALNDACSKWKAAENIDYSVYGTPLESTTYKFAKCLQKRFGMIKDVTDHNYITNSYHVNVRESIDAFTKLSFESAFQELSPGGAISYVEVPNMQDNIPAVLAIIKYIYDHIMYAELNTKSDFCEECSYDGEMQIVEDESHKLIWKCPHCGNTNQDKLFVARRTCGYIGTEKWNQGRTQEIKDRILHVSTEK